MTDRTRVGAGVVDIIITILLRPHRVSEVPVYRRATPSLISKGEEEDQDGLHLETKTSTSDMARDISSPSRATEMANMVAVQGTSHMGITKGT